MSLFEFYLIAAALVLLAVVFVVMPLLFGKSHKETDTLTNAQLIKGRLSEIEREVNEGVLSQKDQTKAENEIKLALLDEQEEEKNTSSKLLFIPVFLSFLAVALGVWVYTQAHHLEGVRDSALAPENIQKLSTKLLDPEASSSIQPDDIQQLALAIRLRLRQSPDDAQGWMFLGRLRASLGQLEEAIAAYERSLMLQPENKTTRVSLAQALMMTGEEDKLKQAQYHLRNLIASSPDNDNLSLMLAVTSAQLGDLDLAQEHYDKIKDKLAEDNPMRVSLEAKLSELASFAVDVETESSTNELTVSRIGIKINVAPDLTAKASEKSHLVVFARAGSAKQGMPIAVKRMAVSSFPITLTLGDEDAMVPEMTISKHRSFNLTARLSTSAEVGAQTGDLEGNIMVDDELSSNLEFNIEINKELQ